MNFDIPAVSPARVERKPERYQANAEVNGIRISVGWDEGYNEYTIYFPDATDIANQLHRIGRDRRYAEDLFEDAKEMASNPIDHPNVEMLCKKIGKIVQATAPDDPIEK